MKCQKLECLTCRRDTHHKVTTIGLVCIDCRSLSSPAVSTVGPSLPRIKAHRQDKKSLAVNAKSGIQIARCKGHADDGEQKPDNHLGSVKK